MWINEVINHSLHESQIKQFIISNSKIIIEFSEGFSTIEPNGKLSIPLHDCCIELSINNLNTDTIDNHLMIMQINKKKIKYINYSSFEKKLCNHTFDVDLDYCSKFPHSLSLIGNINNKRFIVTIFDIINAKYKY